MTPLVTSDVNLVAVFSAAVVAMVLGALWYSPILFGKQWMKMVGLTNKDLKKFQKEGKMGLYYLGGFLSGLVMVYVVAHVLVALAPTNTKEAFVVVGWLWLGFIVTRHFGGFLWERKPFNLVILNSAYDLVMLALTVLILMKWPV